MKKIIVTISFSMLCAMAFSQIKAPDDIQALLEKNNCVACHKADKKALAPSWKEISEKQYSAKKFTELVYKPVPANWPTYTPMVGLPKVPKADLSKIATWVKGL
jgi:cytochrome c